MSRKTDKSIQNVPPSDMFGKKLHEIRTIRGVTIQKLSDALDLSRNYISQLEKGDRYPSFDVLIAIANYFKISTDDLLRDYLSPSIQNKIIGENIAQSIAQLSLSQQKHLEKMIKNEVDFLMEAKQS